jgi:hypothetical protein
MSTLDNTDYVRALMLQFAERSGLNSQSERPRRYLWTDAHAVCNYLSLYNRTGDDEYRQLAVLLIDQVHRVLGRHREDDIRRGWLSGLDDEQGRLHPTAGGLRIGKQVNERGVGEAYDERLEWDRDGQYFHYLTKWMHALYRASVVLQDARYCCWAVDLAQAAYAGFARTDGAGAGKRLVWKMSIDLSRPLVASTGQHDPLDGFITCNELGLCGGMRSGHEPIADLSKEKAELAEMLDAHHWSTTDPLGIGGLLFDVCRVLQLNVAGHRETAALMPMLISDARRSLEGFTRHSSLAHPAAYRLAFRELGLSIGLRAVERMHAIADTHADIIGDTTIGALNILSSYVPQGRSIEDFWRQPESQQVQSWRDHADINSVMLATSLLPDEFLAL